MSESMASRHVLPAAKVFAFAGCDEWDRSFRYQETGIYTEPSYCYDEDKTWAENIANGLPQRCRDLPPSERCWAPEEKWVAFLNHKLASPFGVAAGPLLSSQWIALAASRGFDILTYKTIRSHYHAGHGLPNILHLDVHEQLPASGPACLEPLFTSLNTRRSGPPVPGPHKAPTQRAQGRTPDTHTADASGGDNARDAVKQAAVTAAASGGAAAASGGGGGGGGKTTCSSSSSSSSTGGDKTTGGGGGRCGGGGGRMLAITNSFGMPSLGPGEVAADLTVAAAALRPGQMMVVSITGTPGRPGVSFREDLHAAARVAVAGGATTLEVNLSCPNVGSSHVALYQDTPAVEELVAGLAAEFSQVSAVGQPGGESGPGSGSDFGSRCGGVVPLMLKVGSFPAHDTDGLRRLLTAAERAGAAAVAGINGLSRRVELPGGAGGGGGGPALGPDRPTSGVCGDPIRAAGLDFVSRARQIIAADGLGLGLVGVGGVTRASHAMEYLRTGADVVQTATGFMWKPHLGTDFQRMWAEAGYTVCRADGRGGRG